MKKILILIIATLIVFSTLVIVKPLSADAPQLVEQPVLIETDRLLAPEAVEEVYANARDDLFWNDKSYSDLIAAIESLSLHGLNSENYHLKTLKLLQSNKLEREKLATDAWHSAAAHLIYGKVDPISVEPDWTAARREADISELMKLALGSGNVTESFNDLAPKQSIYRVLQSELVHLRSIAEKPFDAVPSGEPLKKSMSGPRVRAMQSRLIELSMLATAEPSGSFDEATLDAVKKFQAEKGFDADGVVGPATISALNLSLQDKIDKVRVNLERARWLPDELGRKHVRVNIAGFQATAWNNGVIERTHSTIIGKPFRKTPVFSDEIEYMIFNPWWETPPSLAKADKLPAFQKDPGAVNRLGFQVLDRSNNIVDATTINWNDVKASSFPYRLRQAPGALNALGQVKIIFPNPHNVYIHDTPTRNLFDKQQRAFSSGCIRTQDPLGLAEWLLMDTPGWNKSKIMNAVLSGKEIRATLVSKIPVHILYNTVIAGQNGNVKYLDDVYGRDDAVLRSLDLEPDQVNIPEVVGE